MCERAGLLIAIDKQSRRALVSRADCDSWKCAECSRRMAENWRMRAKIGAAFFIREGVRLDFVTITSHEKLKTFEATEAVWRKAWPVLYAALKRKAKTLEYLVIPEKHKDGRMHVHALWTADVTERWLKDNARKRGLGYKASVSCVENGDSAARYVSKYVGKMLGVEVPLHFRRVRPSRNWPEIPRPITEHSELTWEYVGTNGALQAVYSQCTREGIDLIDMKTGEMFDDIDLGTIVWGS